MKFISLPIQMAPEKLSQSILPNWGFSFFNINLGRSSKPEVELDVLEKVGSYGTQIGHLAEALEVVINQLKILDKDLSQDERDAVQVFLGDVAAVRKVKKNPKKLS